MARDITADIGPLYRDGRDPKIPMYSYERPAYILWQAVFEGLVEAGKTEEQAIDWLQSKNPPMGAGRLARGDPEPNRT